MIKRYTPCNHRSCDDGMAESTNGNWVNLNDYMALTHIHERSKDQYRGIIDTQLNAIDRLNEKILRLERAGDAMANTRHAPISLSEFSHLAMAWEEAKKKTNA